MRRKLKLGIYLISIAFTIFNIVNLMYNVNLNKNISKIEKNKEIDTNKNSLKEVSLIDYNEKEFLLKDDIREIEKNELKKIVIDPGHSINSSNETELISPNSNKKKLKDTIGATGIKSKRLECEIVNNIAIELEKILKECGYIVYITKRDINRNMSNIERAKFGNDNSADLVIKLHCDSINSKDVHGASMLIPKINGYITKEISEKSKKYGQKIIDTYTKEVGIKNRGLIYRDDLTGFNWSKVPVVLLELGFLSNIDEDRYLSSTNNHKRIALGIANGIDLAFK